MGVPVVVLSGDRHASRVGTSILNSLDRGNWIATDENRYVEIAMNLANSSSNLSFQRNNLRKNLEDSPLMDQAAFTKNFESTMRDIWQEWCGTQS